MSLEERGITMNDDSKTSAGESPVYRYGVGKITSAHLSRGTPMILADCEDYECKCVEHDYVRSNPKPAGTYIEVKLEKEGVGIWPTNVWVLTEDEVEDLKNNAKSEVLRSAETSLPKIVANGAYDPEIWAGYINGVKREGVAEYLIQEAHRVIKGVKYDE